MRNLFVRIFVFHLIVIAIFLIGLILFFGLLEQIRESKLAFLLLLGGALLLALVLSFSASQNLTLPLLSLHRRILNFPKPGASIRKRTWLREMDLVSESLDSLLHRLSSELHGHKIEKELLESLLGALREGVLCLNRDGAVLYQNPAVSSELVGPRSIGRPYFKAITNAELLEYTHEMMRQRDRLAAGGPGGAPRDSEAGFQVLDRPGGKPAHSTNGKGHGPVQVDASADARAESAPYAKVEYGGAVGGARLQSPVLELNQSRRHFRIQGYPVRTDSEEIELYLLLIQDRTQEYNTRRLREDFLQNASHELKTPITSIRGYAETLHNREARETQKSFLSGIIRNVERMEAIIEDMVMISSLESRSFPFHPMQVDLESYMANIESLVSGSLKQKNQGLNIQAERGVVFEADPLLLEHLLLNLIANAGRYSPPETEIEVRILRETRGVLFEIEDRGPGIPRDLREKIFERFFRVDKDRSRMQGGTGLGLSIVRQISRLHGGRVWVDEGRHGGALFRVLLPQGKAASQEEQESAL